MREILQAARIVLVGWVVVLFAPVAMAASEFDKHLDRNWSPAKVTADGKAEISVYRGKEVLRKKSRSGRVVMLLEPTQWQLIKEFPVGVSNYQQSIQLAINANSVGLDRLFSCFMEWGRSGCRGIDKNKVTIVSNSRETAKNAVVDYPAGALQSAIPYDALPFLLRRLDFDKGGFNFTMVESLQSEATTTPTTGAAKVVFAPETTLIVDAKSYKVRPVIVTHFVGEDSFWFQADGSKTLVQWSRYNGSEYVLRNQQHLEYWNLTQDFDGSLIP